MEQEKQTSLWRVLLKALILFSLCNLVFMFSNPMPLLGKLSLYNSITPGRERFPFGEEPDKAYNLSLNSIEAMFASHIINGAPKAPDEFRVVLIGDSSTWGFYLDNEDTLASLLNNTQSTTSDGKQLIFYNLGYPTISLTKDLMIIDEALNYQPDLIVWLVTLEAFPYEKQTFTPLVQNNLARILPLIEQYDLKIDPQDEDFINPTVWEKSIIGQRRPLADLLRLQLHGFAWGQTGIDQYIPPTYDLRANDLEAVESYYGFTPEQGVNAIDLAFDVLAAGIEHVGDTPILIINEPIFIANGENSDIRYNFFYPRWIYTEYQTLLKMQVTQTDAHYLDAWGAVENTEFTNSAIHITPAGSQQLAEQILDTILEIIK